MTLNNFMKRLSTTRRWIARTLFSLLAIAFVWQGAFFSNTAAIADTNLNFIANSGMGDGVQEKADKDAGRAKNFIQDTADKVKQTAHKNADKVGQATDDNNSFLERKANKDAARIEQKADKDAARTQKAVDDTKNVVERTVENIKDAFSN